MLSPSIDAPFEVVQALATQAMKHFAGVGTATTTTTVDKDLPIRRKLTGDMVDLGVGVQSIRDLQGRDRCFGRASNIENEGLPALIEARLRLNRIDRFEGMRALN